MGEPMADEAQTQEQQDGLLPEAPTGGHIAMQFHLPPGLTHEAYKDLVNRQSAAFIVASYLDHAARGGIFARPADIRVLVKTVKEACGVNDGEPVGNAAEKASEKAEEKAEEKADDKADEKAEEKADG